MSSKLIWGIWGIWLQDHLKISKICTVMGAAIIRQDDGWQLEKAN